MLRGRLANNAGSITGGCLMQVHNMYNLPDMNINDQPNLTPCKNNQQQNRSCSCGEVSFSIISSGAFFLPPFNALLWFPAPPSVLGEAMKGSF